MSVHKHLMQPLSDLYNLPNTGLACSRRQWDNPSETVIYFTDKVHCFYILLLILVHFHFRHLYWCHSCPHRFGRWVSQGKCWTNLVCSQQLIVTKLRFALIQAWLFLVSFHILTLQQQERRKKKKSKPLIPSTFNEDILSKHQRATENIYTNPHPSIFSFFQIKHSADSLFVSLGAKEL